MKVKKILVVDDDPIVLESCKRVLQEEGYRVSLTKSAHEAIELLEEEYFDLLLLDVKMPEKDGVYLMEKIREKWDLKIWPELPVLVMSGYPTPDTIKEMMKRGARQFISKPFTPDELISAVKKVLERRKKHESSGD